MWETTGHGLFSLEEALLWILDLYFGQKKQFKDGTGVDYCDDFIMFGLSFWRHPFTADDPLVSKWCKLMYILNGLNLYFFAKLFLY